MMASIGSFVVGLLMGGCVVGLFVWVAAKSAAHEMRAWHQSDLERIGALHKWQMEAVRRQVFADGLVESSAVVVKPKVSLQR